MHVTDLPRRSLVKQQCVFQIIIRWQMGKYIEMQVPSYKRRIMQCSKRTTSGGKGREDGEEMHEQRVGGGVLSCTDLYVFFPSCCCTDAHSSQAVVIDSSGISKGTCA